MLVPPLVEGLHPEVEGIGVALQRVRVDDRIEIPWRPGPELEAGHDRVCDTGDRRHLDLPNASFETGCAAHVSEMLEDGPHARATLSRSPHRRWRLSGTDEVRGLTGNIPVGR